MTTPASEINPEKPSLSLRVLVAEDSRINRALLNECLSQAGHIPILAEDGAQAVALFQTEMPDVVLLDIVMPIMDGLEAARQIRALPAGETIPLVFLSAVDNEQAKIDSLELADAFIPKPIEPHLLMAKLNAFFRQVRLRRQLQQQAEQTEKALTLLEEEAQMGIFVLTQVLKTTRTPDQCVRYLVKPTLQFSGDLVLYERTPQGHYTVLLADAAGHGIAAAFNVFPLISVFTAATRSGLPMDETLRKMNSVLRELMPLERFVTAALVTIDPKTLLMQIWNGGLPPVLVLDGQGAIKQQFNSSNLPLRLANDLAFDSTPTHHQLDCGDEIILYSDGLLEANHESPQEGLERLKSLLQNEPEARRFDKLAGLLNEEQSDLIFHDDVSLISIRTSAMNTSGT